MRRRNPFKRHRMPGIFPGLWCLFFWGTTYAQLPNSSAQELAPVFSPKGDTLFFVRDGHPQNKGLQDAWFSVRGHDGRWSEALPLPLNTRFDDAVVALTAEGLYLANQSTGRRSRPGLSLSRYRNGQWQKPEAIDLPGLSTASGHIGFHVVSDSLLLVAMPAAGREDDDLFLVPKTTSRAEPIPLGLNSDGNDFAPFWREPYLYFASDRGGNADLYRARRLSDDWSEWGDPEPLTAINTPGFEAYPAFHPTEGWLCFVRAEEGRDADLVVTTETMLFKEKPIEVPATTGLAVSRTGTIYFPFNSAELVPTALDQLRRLAVHAQQEAPRIIQVVGFADAVGEAGSNKTLSMRRAEAIRAFLLEKGIPDSVIRLSAEGKEKAVVPSDSPESDRQPDRKAEIQFLK